MVRGMDDGDLKPCRGAREAVGSEPIRLVGALAVAAGSIHALAMVQHFSEGVLYGVFFAVVATSQLAWGTWVYRHPDKRRYLAAAAIANVSIVLIWVLSRTTGLPLGSRVGQPEVPGLIDVLATLDELGIVVFVIAILRPGGRLGTRLAVVSADQQTRFGAALVTATICGMLLGSHAH